jgi:DNA-binding transcriptional ArsR family regulator
MSEEEGLAFYSSDQAQLTLPGSIRKVHQVVNFSSDGGVGDLDRLFGALANEHRREMVYMLGLQPNSISRLAAARGLSLPAMNKHVRVLEAAGLVTRRKSGRTTFLALDRAAMRGAQTWFARYHPYWGNERETLENYERYLASAPADVKEE